MFVMKLVTSASFQDIDSEMRIEMPLNLIGRTGMNIKYSLIEEKGKLRKC